MCIPFCTRQAAAGAVGAAACSDSTYPHHRADTSAGSRALSSALKKETPMEVQHCQICCCRVSARQFDATYCPCWPMPQGSFRRAGSTAARLAIAAADADHAAWRAVQLLADCCQTGATLNTEHSGLSTRCCGTSDRRGHLGQFDRRLTALAIGNSQPALAD